MAMPLYNPPVPFLGGIDGNMRPGKMVRIQGTVPPSANRFVVNLKCGPYEQHDIALHLSIRFPELKVIRNSLIDSRWGPEETVGHMPFSRGSGFELLILCDPDHFKIAVNGQHFTEYIHRTPYERITHLHIHQDVTLSLIQWDGGNTSVGAPLTPGFVIPPAPAPHHPPTLPPHSVGPCPPPPLYPGHNVPPGQLPHSPGYPHSAPGYPHSAPGYPHSAPGHPPGYPPPPLGCPPPPPGYPGAGHRPGTGTMLGAGLAGAAVTGHLSPKKAAKSKKKAYKKALKYGLPIAGVGVGAYAAHKVFHGFHSSSSSSSSSSEEE